MPFAQIASSHYEPDGQGDGRKWCVNYYAEKNGQDPARPMRLVTTPGSRVIDDGTEISGTVRGLAQADGHAGGNLLLVDDTRVRAYNPATGTWGSLTGSVAGSDRVKWAIADEEACILSGGDLFVSDGLAVARVTDGDWITLLSDHGQLGFIDVATLGQRLIAAYGERIAYSNTLDFNQTTALSFYTAENQPDGIKGLAVLAARLYVFGAQTIEIWVQSGNDDDPLRAQFGSTIPRGCYARDSIAQLDNSLFFIGDDGNPYRLQGLAPQILNPESNWVTRAIRATDPADVICDAIEDDGHAFYVIRLPSGCLVYDVSTRQWHKRQTHLSDSWDWRFFQRIGSQQYAASTDALVELSRKYASDRQPDAETFGTEIVRQSSAHMPVMNNRRNRPITAIRVDGSKGVGLTAGQGSDPVMTLYLSKDNGLTFTHGRQCSLGQVGEYGIRTLARRWGRFTSPQVVLRMEVSDPVFHSITGVAVGED